MEFWFSEFHTPDVKHSIREMCIRDRYKVNPICNRHFN